MTCRSRRTLRRTSIVALAVALGAPAAASAASCPAQPTHQAFSRFGDTQPYALLPGGRFERSLEWSRGGGTGLVWENNPFHLSGRGDMSVRLRDRDSVTTPTFCASAQHPHVRFVARALEIDSDLDVELLWTDRYGRYHEDEVAEIDDRAYRNWGPSPEVPVGDVLPTAGGAIFDVRLRFTMDDNDGGWLIDDVYVDPRASR